MKIRRRCHWPVLAVAFSLCTMTGYQSQALAQRPKVLLVPYQPVARQATPELAAQVSKALITELESSKAFELVAMEGEAVLEPALEDIPGTADMDVGKGDLAKAVKKLAAADKFLKKYRFDQAISFYQRAIEQFDAAAPAVVDVAPIADAYVRLGVAAFRRSKEQLAEEALAQAVALDPERTLDPREFPPLLLRVYDDVFRKTLRAPRGEIAVDASVAGAEVFFNGRSVGATPIVLKNVPPGRHFVRIVKEGAGVFGQRVEVVSDATVKVNAELGESKASTKKTSGNGFVAVAAAISGNRVDVVVTEAAQALGSSAGAAFVAFGGVRKSETSISVASFLVDVESGKLVRLIDLDLDFDMLSVSIEAFKLSEDLSNNVQEMGKDIGPGPHSIVRGIAAEEQKGPAEVNVGPAVPNARSSRIAAVQDGSRRPLGDGEGNQRSVIDTGKSTGGRRQSLNDGENALDDRQRKTIAEIDEPGEWYESPWLWIGTGSAAALLVGGGVAGVTVFMLTRPPEKVAISAQWP